MVALEACDMRKSFNGLAALGEGQLGEEVRGGTIYVFGNPFDYLRDGLTRLPWMTNWQIKDITPDARRSDPIKQAA